MDVRMCSECAFFSVESVPMSLSNAYYVRIFSKVWNLIKINAHALDYVDEMVAERNTNTIFNGMEKRIEPQKPQFNGKI